MRPDADCALCPLCAGRNVIVLAHGDHSSPVVFVGEAPGEAEDRLGIPFVGRSGKILERLMEEEGFSRAKVLITNTVKCRPPGNRDPTAEEMSACLPFLEHELKDRKLIIGLGKSACRDLLHTEVMMKQVANQRMRIIVSGQEIDFIPTYHPAACIYSREARSALQETIRTVKKEYFTP